VSQVERNDNTEGDGVTANGPDNRLDWIRVMRGRHWDEVKVSRFANRGIAYGGGVDGGSPRGRIVEAIFCVFTGARWIR
jgi:hypothetical protein